METVKLGKKGQVSIPEAVLKQLGIEGEATLLVETTSDGAIILRPAAAYPVEIYGAGRVAEFDEADRMDAATAERVERALRRTTGERRTVDYASLIHPTSSYFE